MSWWDRSDNAWDLYALDWGEAGDGDTQEDEIRIISMTWTLFQNPARESGFETQMSSLWALSDVSSRHQLGNKVSEVWEEAISPPWPQPPTQFWLAPAEESSQGGQPLHGWRWGWSRRVVSSQAYVRYIITHHPRKYYDTPWGRAVVQAE